MKNLLTTLTVALACVGPTSASRAEWLPQEPEAAVVVLVPGDEDRPSDDRSLTAHTRRLLAALQTQGRLNTRPSDIAPATLRPCADFGVEPSEARTRCVRERTPSAAGQPPVVTVVLGFTTERGAWQRMECIGPRATGFNRTIYVQDSDHPRADVRASPENALERCVKAALETPPAPVAERPVPPAAAPAPSPEIARMTATLNWETCLQAEARRAALAAVDARRGRPHPDVAFQACAEREDALARVSDAASIEALRARYATVVRQEIDQTYRQYNYD